MATTATPHVSRIRLPYRPIVEITPDYSRAPIEAGFNWDEAFARVGDGEWHLVAFRSRHAPDADETFLTQLDERASAAASRHPGFLYYFIGAPQADGQCLSFCLWRSAEAARAASADPEHRDAVARGLPSFAHYRLERYRIVKRAGRLTFQPLADPRGTDAADHPAAAPERPTAGIDAGLTPASLAALVDAAFARCWRGDDDARRDVASWLSSFWRDRLPPPSTPPSAASLFGAGGRGIHWHRTPLGLLGAIAGGSGGYLVPPGAALPPTLARLAATGV
jgi:heme-degrading monooxygenase HmoA